MNPLDIEIARYIQTAELSFHFSAESDEHEFAYQYFRSHAQERLSPKAYGRLRQDLSLKNIKGFTRSYKAAKHVVYSAAKMRYLVTTLTDEERVSSFLAKIEKHRIRVARDMKPLKEVDALLKEFKFGVVFVPEASPADISQLTLYYALPNPAFLHLLRDTAAAWGYAGDYPAVFEKNTLVKVTLVLTDDQPEQQEMIDLGKTESLKAHPHLAKDNA